MKSDIVRAWKDAKYRQNLTSGQQDMLPENPAGSCELTDADLEAVQGGNSGEPFTTLGLKSGVLDLTSGNKFLENLPEIGRSGYYLPSVPSS